MTISYEGSARRDHWSGDITADYDGKIYYQPVFDFTQDPPALTWREDKDEPNVNTSSNAFTRSLGAVVSALGGVITLALNEREIADRKDELEETAKASYDLQDTLDTVIKLMELPGGAVLRPDFMVQDEHLYFRVSFKR